MALEGREIVHARAGVNVAERVPIADRAAAVVMAPGYADRFMKDSPNPSRGGSPAQHAARPPSEWSTGFYSVHRDCCGCIYTSICPCLLVGRIGSFLYAPTSKYRHCCGFLGFWCCSSFQHRAQIRMKFNLPAEPCNDFCAHVSCMCCALCQEQRELSRRGVDLRWFWPKGHCGSPTCRAKHAPGEMIMYK